MDLVLVRHTEPERGLAGVTGADPHLSRRGREQAVQAGRALALEPFAALYCSPMRRALETAKIVSEAVGLDAVVDEDLAEFDRGAQYLHFEDVGATGNVYENYMRDDLSPWGTTAVDFRTRVTAAFDRIVASHPGRAVIVVSHGGVANAYLGGLLGIDRIHFHSPEYGSISRVRASKAGVRTVVSLNETSHLRLSTCPDPAAHAAALSKSR